MKDEKTVWVQRDEKWIRVPTRDLTTFELCYKLNCIQLDSDEFLSGEEIAEGYNVIEEAIRRLNGEP